MTDSEVDLRRSDDAVAAVATAWRTTLRVTAVCWVLVGVVVVAAAVLGEPVPERWLLALTLGAIVASLLVPALRVLPARRWARSPWSELGERDRMRVDGAGGDAVRIDALAPRLRLAAVVRLRLQVLGDLGYARFLAWQAGGLTVAFLPYLVASGEWWPASAPMLGALFTSAVGLVRVRGPVRSARATLAALS